MQGRNELRLNTETVMDAVEYWLNKVVLKDSVKVTSIEELSAYSGRLFVVEIRPEYEDEC